MPSPSEDTHQSRRDLLKKAAIGGGVAAAVWTAPHIAGVAGAQPALLSECACIQITSGPESGNYFSYGGTFGPFYFSLFSDPNCTSPTFGEYFDQFYASNNGDPSSWCDDLCDDDPDCSPVGTSFTVLIANCGGVDFYRCDPDLDDE